MAGYPPGDFRTVVRAALDEGVSLFDLQPNYGEAERYLSPMLKEHGARLFVVTKTWGQSKRAVIDSIAGSLSRLNAPRVDAVLLNNIGDYDLRALFHADGALAGLKEARRRGQVRFFGLSGHWRPEHFVQALESGEFDIVMAPFNFVDRHTYSFERDILPVAAKHDIGVVAMKTLGGAVGLKYDTRQQTAMLPERHHRGVGHDFRGQRRKQHARRHEKCTSSADTAYRRCRGRDRQRSVRQPPIQDGAHLGRQSDHRQRDRARQEKARIASDRANHRRVF
jgi:aryl-alcohol dehydrogenase-like predicted oxidoreductase